MSSALHRAASDRRHEQHFIAFLEGVCLTAKEANIFLIHVDIEESPNLSFLVAQMRLQFGELFVENGEEFSEIGDSACDRSNSGGVAPKRSRNLYCDWHCYAPTASAAAITPGRSAGLNTCCCR